MAGPRSAVDYVPNTIARGPGLDIRSGPHTFISPSADSRKTAVSYWQMCVHLVLSIPLGGLSLHRNSVARLLDRPNMGIAVIVDVKQQQHNNNKNNNKEDVPLVLFHFERNLHRSDF